MNHREMGGWGSYVILTDNRFVFDLPWLSF